MLGNQFSTLYMHLFSTTIPFLRNLIPFEAGRTTWSQVCKPFSESWTWPLSCVQLHLSLWDPFRRPLGLLWVVSVENEMQEIDLLNQLQCLLFQIDSQKLWNVIEEICAASHHCWALCVCCFFIGMYSCINSDLFLVYSSQSSQSFYRSSPIIKDEDIHQADCRVGRGGGLKDFKEGI